MNKEQTMNIEQEREEFEAWALKERIAYRDEKRGVCFHNGERNSYWIGYQAGRAALQSQDREDAERLDWLLRKLPGNAIRYCVGVLADTADIDEFRDAIDHALLACGGNHE